jgi:hypothetical protein
MQDLNFNKKEETQMSAPGKAQATELVRIQSGQRLATRPVRNPAREEATNRLKPGGRTRQAVTQVKGWSPENTIVREADTVHFAGRQQGRGRQGETSTSPSGSETTACQENGRVGTREIHRVPEAGKRGQAYKRQGIPDDAVEVGLAHSTGEAR